MAWRSARVGDGPVVSGVATASLAVGPTRVAAAAATRESNWLPAQRLSSASAARIERAAR